MIFFEGIFISLDFDGMCLPRLPWLSQETCQMGVTGRLAMNDKLKNPDFRGFWGDRGFRSLRASFPADFENRNIVLSNFEFRRRISLKPGENPEVFAGMPFAPVQATWR
ncbi:hypothetical protein [Anderseniella sp. Alg231-50]|uniref:hypothetical protein n=1 Tax=Anderseniella sp. Alg231-50 TaxID=1922226 RepID=UPI00307C5322